MDCKKTGSWLIYEKNGLITRSETQDALENGRLRPPTRTVARKQLNFESYPKKGVTEVFKKKPVFDNISSYKRDYPPPGSPRCEKFKAKENDPDPLFNRRPVNDFLMLPSATTKFMDDSLYNVGPGRMKINFFRQLRYRSFLSTINDTEENATDDKRE